MIRKRGRGRGRGVSEVWRRRGAGRSGGAETRSVSSRW